MILFNNISKMKPPSRQSVNETAICLPRNQCLTWKNISYTVEVKKNEGYLKEFLCGKHLEHVEILHGISGVVKSGTLLAILGSSGAGKTTLLATISKRIKRITTGDILLNGKQISRELLSKISGFVPQDEIAIKSLTVQEHMEFMAKMKMDRRFRHVARIQKIDNLLSDLGLTELKNAKLSTLSHGEWKRVSLAVELIIEPKILFCDEPTTGLDSYSATVVTETLKNTAARGKIVICSLHQPASGILEHFHQVLLLAAGKVAFQGSINDTISFFDSQGYCCPPTFNYAEFFVSQLSITRGHEEECMNKIDTICSEFKKSTYNRKITALIEESSVQKIDQSPHPIFMESFSTNDFKKIRTLTQLEWLTWRNFIDYKRNISSTFWKFFIYMFGGVLLAMPYIGVTENIDQRSIQNIQGLMYYVVTETIFTYHYAVFYTFPKELPLLLRDMANGLYYPAPYYVSKILIMIPGSIIEPFIYAALIYFMTGLKGGLIGFLFFVTPIVFGAISATALGCLFSASFKSFDTASLLSVCIDFVTLIFSGIYLNLSNVPSRISWLKYISQFYYSTEAVSVMQWLQYNHIDCAPYPEESCITSGEGVLKNYGFSPGNYYIDLAGLTAIFLVGHLAGFLAILYRSRKEPIY
ncbi:protein scarlet-like [Chelonus insularis]|uniref:protein scarlet-like n=1 Tax=Chelonus insularis TaxID=460826 RepID=UPI00158BB883|nr:protein scarlet-like [Chelonus insularis]